MSKHSQKPARRLMTCPACKHGHCEDCVDILRIAYTDKMICTCERKEHNGEPVDQQVRDPFTGTIHAPSLTIDKEGNVTFLPSVLL